MADVEDEAEFGSHFLDSMLEVEMTEEDNVLDVSKNCDPLETLPPVPTFDLQSETLSYKEVYKNAIPQPVLATLPLPTASKVPLVIKPSSVLIYSGEVPPQKPPPVLAPVQKISPKSNAKNLAKNAAVVVNNTPEEERTNKKFLKEVFKPEFVKNVFVKAEPPSDLAVVTDEEIKYYNSCFKDVSKVQNCRLHCTICDKHIGCAASVEKKINVHKMLKVLTCKPCHEFYGDGNFPCDKKDNCEIYCRWCGQGGALVCCSFCPRVFCKKCVRRNYGIPFLNSVERSSDWACFCCAQKPLWPHRAICRALLEYLSQRKTDQKASPKDTSSCCRAAGLIRKRLRAALDKNKVTPPPIQPKVGRPPKNPELKTKNSPGRPPKAQILLNPAAKNKTPDTSKTSTTSTNTPANRTPKPLSSIFSPRSILTGSTIIRGITTTNAPKFISTFPSTQLIQAPVIHGETLITPPSRLLLQPKTTPSPAPSNPSYVKVSLTHQTPNVDVSKIPTVKIPHEVQGLVLRLILPDNKMQYVRLASDGSQCKATNEFPMPQFPESGGSFVEENLVEAFQMTKSLYEKLLRVREKVNSRTKFTEESVFNSSVKKLHTAYATAVNLFNELDRTLLENHEEWKKAGKTVDVIEVSDDEVVAKKTKVDRYSSLREKWKTLNDDSDIEIIDDVTVNGKTGNYKEKYRLKSAAELKCYPSDNGEVPPKRKKGRPRKQNKRLKVDRMQNGKDMETIEQVEMRNEKEEEGSREEYSSQKVAEYEPEYDEGTRTGDEEAEEGKGDEETEGGKGDEETEEGKGVEETEREKVEEDTGAESSGERT